MARRKNRRAKRQNRQTEHPSPRGEGKYARYPHTPSDRKRTESAGKPELPSQ